MRRCVGGLYFSMQDTSQLAGSLLLQLASSGNRSVPICDGCKAPVSLQGGLLQSASSGKLSVPTASQGIQSQMVNL